MKAVIERKQRVDEAFYSCLSLFFDVVVVNDHPQLELGIFANGGRGRE